MAFTYRNLDLSQYSIEGIIENGMYSNFYRIKENKSQKVYLAEISRCEIPKDVEDDIHFYEKEIEHMAGLNHPLFLKFIGFNSKDFKSLKRPTIVTEYSGQHTLEYIFKCSEGELQQKWNDTQKLICIYGIASGMAYLHKKKIVHGDLNPKTILIDDFYQPKILYSKIPKIIYKTYKIFDENDDLSLNFIPENIFDDLYYDKANDVLSFASILYLILNDQENSSEKVNKPFQFDDNATKAFQRLYEKCSSEDPDKRPTFESITYSLKNDDEFISEKVDSEFYHEYIESIEKANLIEISKNDDNGIKETESDSQNDDFDVVKNESDEKDYQTDDSQSDGIDAFNYSIENENDDDDDSAAVFDSIENDNDNGSYGANDFQRIKNENDSICSVCKNEIESESDALYYQGIRYHSNCIKCRICDKKLISSKTEEEEEEESEQIQLNHDLICVAPGLFFCRNDFNKYKNHRNQLPELIQEEYLNKMIKSGIDGLFNSFYDYNKDDKLMNGIETDNLLPINKYFKLFVPSVTFHFSNSIRQINFKELINVIPKNMIIINIERGSTFLTIAFIASNKAPNTEKEYLEIIHPLKKYFNSAIGNSIVGSIIDEPIFNFPNNESIKQFFQKESINILQLNDILDKIDINQIKNEVTMRFKSKYNKTNFKFILNHMKLFDEAEESIRKDIENNEIELVITGITIIANKNYKNYKKIVKKLNDEKVELFLYHGTKIRNHSIIATKGFLSPIEMRDKHNTDDGLFGEGIYATNNIFYSSMYSIESNSEIKDYLPYYAKCSVICCKSIYNNKFCAYLNDLKYLKFYSKDTNFVGLEMSSEIQQNHGIHLIFVESSTRFQTTDINKKYVKRKKKFQSNKPSYVSAFEYVFPDENQIIPVLSITVMRPMYYVLWLNEIQNNDYIEILNGLRYISDVNIYCKNSIDDAFHFVDKKIRNMLKFIISVDDCESCENFIERIRQCHFSNFVCLIFSKDKKFMKLALEMENVLFTNKIEYFQKFVQIPLDNETISEFYEELQVIYDVKFNINEDGLTRFHPIIYENYPT